jgi:hypothetical protein
VGVTFEASSFAAPGRADATRAKELLETIRKVNAGQRQIPAY